MQTLTGPGASLPLLAGVAGRSACGASARSLVVLAVGSLLTLSACSTKVAPLKTVAPAPPSGHFSHAELETVLQRFVDTEGRVDYAALQSDPESLERYYRLLAEHSPDSDPELFGTDAERLAYWINAYNAAVMKLVITYYPIGSVLEVKRPWYAFLLSNKAGFFYYRRVVLGDEFFNLRGLEGKVIRKRFGEPRTHFALNCASLGCPRLPRHAFSAERLDEELEREARHFLAEERNFRIDDATRAIYLSEIFKWYENEFVDWAREQSPGERLSKEQALLAYIARYLPTANAERLEGKAAGYAIRFIPYDWALNDQNPSVAVSGATARR